MNNPKKVDSNDRPLRYDRYYNVYADGLTVRRRWNGTYFVIAELSLAGVFAATLLESPRASCIFPTK